jgi:hypothetical protein
MQVAEVSEWTVIRYDADGWPSHPDEDLPPEGVQIEMWRTNGLEWLMSLGSVVRHESQGHQTATMRQTRTGVHQPPPDIPDPAQGSGVVWRLA